MRENDFLRWITENTQAHARVPVGIGDDMALVHMRGSTADKTPALLKIDQCLDRVHFDLREHTAAQVGRKAVNRCLSDCAGMACLPAAIVISVALPRELPGTSPLDEFAKSLFLAARDAAAHFDCPLVGGDTAIWDQRLAITVSALGELPLAPDKGTPHAVLRSGAKPGDTLFVSGALGGSILGRHLTFEPRINLAQKLARALGTGPTSALHAMMDLSDGLAQDLPRLCAASSVGAEVFAARLPVHADAEALAAKDGIPAGLHALADGEDYELLFAVETEAIPKLIDISEKGGVSLSAIGTVGAGKELLLVDEAGRRHAWPRAGWEHKGGNGDACNVAWGCIRTAVEDWLDGHLTDPQLQSALTISSTVERNEDGSKRSEPGYWAVKNLGRGFTNDGKHKSALVVATTVLCVADDAYAREASLEFSHSMHGIFLRPFRWRFAGPRRRPGRRVAQVTSSGFATCLKAFRPSL